MTQGLAAEAEADVIVVGAGPAGSTAAAYLARRGLDVLLLEKSAFPREKVCGDGLTPRATRQLIRLGIDTSEQAGWLHNKGLRIYGGDRPFELNWPDLTDFPPYGLVRPRADFDDLLAKHAVAAGAKMLENCNVTEPVLDERTGRIRGVRTRDGRTFLAPLVVAADGNSTRLSVAMGLQKKDNRPMGVAVRTYYTSPRTNDDYLESWLELWDGKPGQSDLLPGYGWIFGMGDGTCNVGLGILNTSSAFGKTDYKDLLQRWLDNTPAEWGFREQNRTIPVRGAALPMGFNRTPHYTRGLLLIGDAGGMVNPFNGEGIAYAMESAELAADAIAEAHYRGVGTPSAERALRGYPTALSDRLGGYYRLGTIFVKLIGNPQVMRLCTRYGLPRRTLMRFTLKLLANLTDASDGDAMDKIINGLSKIAPSA
ncbi:geranylgeranyl reductase family protein [Naumannella cuiyingiana]|uniref:Geranylgeranyl reductase family protein n=1 Tax=Naumannella cuiyingiana TaxID=1347891 RepID=A0A7Z0IKJ8_9ACTN|nr:geranylgeranyl reductase family protein [Naumannella cuiyingiana]NYI70611.1 geranylgeranyl reductase family protein [Naumannella cuiyingiana]